MRQRNDTGYEKHVGRWPSEEYPDDHSFVVGVGEEVDRPYEINGFTLLKEDDTPKPRRKDAAVAADKEEGEPQ